MNAPERPVSLDLIHHVTPDALATTMRELGYRVQLAPADIGPPELRSSTQGLGFRVRFGHEAAPGAHDDLMFLCPVACEDAAALLRLPAAWNREKRYGRLHELEHHLVLTLDVTTAGGVADTWLRAQCELWDRLLQEFVLFVRQERAEERPASAA